MGQSSISDSINIVFDLDGTLIDSQPGIYLSLKHSLAACGLSNDFSPSQVPIGPPLTELVQLLADTKERSVIDSVIAKFKSHYDSCGFRSSHLFSGVYPFLESLYDDNFNLFIATNKRLAPTLKILNYFSIIRFFKAVYAVDSHETFDSKSSMLKSLITSYSINSNSIYIGDRLDDFIAAFENSISFRYPSWGYSYDHDLFPRHVKGLDLCSPDQIKSLLIA